MRPLWPPRLMRWLDQEDYEAYVEDSIEGLRFRYQPIRLITLAPDRMVNASMVLGKEV